MKKFLVFGVLFLVAAIAVTLFVLSRNGGGNATPGTSETKETGRPSLIAEVEPAADPCTQSAADAPEATTETEEPMTPEERAWFEQEQRVDNFDALTDRWMEPSEKVVTMADIEAFAQMFANVPKDRREECLQRALNLIPDENVMLLAGILMDKSLEQNLLELVFNDILNRDDDVKNPILRQVLQDPEHPCRKDAAWILDVPE